MWWGNRLLYNNDKLKPIASVGGVKVTSIQAITPIYMDPLSTDGAIVI